MADFSTWLLKNWDWIVSFSQSPYFPWGATAFLMGGLVLLINHAARKDELRSMEAKKAAEERHNYLANEQARISAATLEAVNLINDKFKLLNDVNVRLRSMDNAEAVFAEIDKLELRWEEARRKGGDSLAFVTERYFHDIREKVDRLNIALEAAGGIKRVDILPQPEILKMSELPDGYDDLKVEGQILAAKRFLYALDIVKKRRNDLLKEMESKIKSGQRKLEIYEQKFRG